MSFTIEPSFALQKKLLGYCYPESVVVFKDQKVTWFLDENQFVQASQKFVAEIILDQEKRKNYLQLWQKRTEDLRKVFDSLSKLNFSSLKKYKFLETYQKFGKVYWNWWTLTMSLELVTVSLEPKLGQLLKTYYPQEHPKEYNRAFSILTSPLVLTFYREEQKDLLKIFSFPKNEQKKALLDHQENFYWILNSYLEGKILDLAYFEEELKKIKLKDYKEAFYEIEGYPDNIRREKAEIIDQIKPSAEVLELISLVEKFSQLQDERKMDNFRADHFLELFVQEFSRRIKAKTSDLKFLLPDELSKSLDSLDFNLIKKRQECFILECTDREIKNWTGDEAEKIAEQFTKVTDVEETMLHGILASTGQSYYFRGTAKIILTIDELDKLHEGDILVTGMTSPDFVLGMKKSGAIITDNGGMLCHAAIVARELKKACIVGTQIATKVIHDGDVVELHCGRGTVKIIKSN